MYIEFAWFRRLFFFQQAAELKKAKDAELEKAKAAAEARLAKKEASQRSLCNLEIKPWEADQDLLALYKKIKETVVFEGLKVYILFHR